MLTKLIIFLFVAVLGCFANAGVIAPFASSYNAHTINHAVAHPVLAPAPAAPYVAAPAAPLVAPAPYVAPAYARSPYSVNPYPYSVNPYSYPGYSGYPYYF